MRVLLINPYYPISETPSPPLGLAYLAASLEAAGADVQVLDLVVYPYCHSRLESLLNNFQPQLVGITAVTMTVDHAIKIIRDIKHINSEILTVIGGPHVSFCARETLHNHPAFDFIALGEGESTMVELAQEVQTTRNWAAVKGIAFRKGSEICITPPRDFIQDLDSLPAPARHLLPLGRYRAVGMPVSLITSRGCPFKCIFCVGRKMVGAKVRYRNPQLVVDEMQYLNTLNFHQINIADDLFTANKRHCAAVCDEIIKRKLHMKWTSFARVDTVSPDVLTRMKAAGCTGVSFGIESGNREILKTIKKGITPRQVIDAVDMCNRAGVTPYGSFILGLPGETPQTLKETLAFGEHLRKMGLAFGFHLLAPFPGTEVREHTKNYDIKILTNDWSEYHANKAIVETPTVNRNMLDDIVVAWKNEFDGYLADIKNRMPTGQATPDEIWQVKNLERIVLVYDLMMKNVIEEKGYLQAENNSLSGNDALQTLVNKIKDSTTYRPADLHDALQWSVEQGNLTYRIDAGQVKWHWVDYL